MRDPVFVQSTKPYPAYSDFWRLARMSGFDTVGAKKLDLSKPGTYIWPTLDSEFMDLLDASPKKARVGKVIFWNLERPDGSYRGLMDMREQFWKGTGEILEWADAVWVSDRGLQSIDTRNVFAIMGGDRRLLVHPKTQPIHDVIHMGQRPPRRQKVLNQIKELGLTLVEPSFGLEREAALASSRLMISIDRVFGIHFCSPLRYVVAAAYGLPILSEQIEDPYPLEAGKTVLMSPYDGLAAAANAALKMPLMNGVLADVGEACRKLLCEEWTFRKGVMDALGRTEGIL